MMLTRFPTTPPYGEVVVAIAELALIQPDPQAAEQESELWLTGNRLIRVSLPFEQVAGQVGPAFHRFQAAEMAPFPVLINRARVSHILPHPQVGNVCYVHVGELIRSVQGGLEAVAAELH